ncbi:MAG: hypothetical protein IH802_05250, partial [Nitrospinae bacterium]|nr:hypothetical protein [Nitrospinota bacterium]
SVREKLEHDREQAFFCQRMSKLVCDILLPVSLEDLALRDLPVASLIAFFEELEFTLLSKRLRQFVETDYGATAFHADESVTTPSSTGVNIEQPTLFT